MTVTLGTPKRCAKIHNRLFPPPSTSLSVKQVRQDSVTFFFRLVTGQGDTNSVAHDLSITGHIGQASRALNSS